MNGGSRHDFFTLIHKGQRKELFAATIMAGTINWEDATAANDFVSLWSKLTSMLEAHAAHEHKHFFPLLATNSRCVTWPSCHGCSPTAMPCSSTQFDNSACWA